MDEALWVEIHPLPSIDSDKSGWREESAVAERRSRIANTVTPADMEEHARLKWRSFSSGRNR
ncbi:hypothetical protein [Agrobacterium fabrum]|uniref:hypothetical protein n=1 Tax=Agrobacterium fabrum TaxID=1176649 RepID=UPI00141DE1EB|nr:hypothetical protein [Agrobacterium fabrum]WCK76195.1 hypothetical protein G6L39_013225 [Agrobacterium fabrum]